jgi:hypothetical protein
LSIKESLIKNVFKPNQKVKAWVSRFTILSYILYISLFSFISVCVDATKMCLSAHMIKSVPVLLFIFCTCICTDSLNNLVSSFSWRMDFFSCMLYLLYDF